MTINILFGIRDPYYEKKKMNSRCFDGDVATCEKLYLRTIESIRGGDEMRKKKKERLERKKENVRIYDVIFSSASSIRRA